MLHQVLTDLQEDVHQAIALIEEDAGPLGVKALGLLERIEAEIETLKSELPPERVVINPASFWPLPDAALRWSAELEACDAEEKYLLEHPNALRLELVRIRRQKAERALKRARKEKSE